jgi:hypothetical protein
LVNVVLGDGTVNDRLIDAGGNDGVVRPVGCAYIPLVGVAVTLARDDHRR